MGKAVEQYPGQALGAEGLGPFVEREVGGDERGAPLVALRDQLEQKLGAGLAQRHEAQLVDDQQFAGDHLLLEPQEAALVAGFHQLVHERGGRGEARREAPLAGGQPEPQGDMGLAGAVSSQYSECEASLLDFLIDSPLTVTPKPKRLRQKRQNLSTYQLFIIRHPRPHNSRP